MSIKPLTDKQRAFIDNYSKTGNAKASAIASGYSKATAEQQGYELKKKLANEIDQATKQVLASSVPMAIDKLQSLIIDDKVNPSVKLGAINSILDRTGYQTVHKVEDVTKQQSEEELQVELNHLLENLKTTEH